MTLDRRGFIGSIMACAAVMATGGRTRTPEYSEAQAELIRLLEGMVAVEVSESPWINNHRDIKVRYRRRGQRSIDPRPYLAGAAPIAVTLESTTRPHLHLGAYDPSRPRGYDLYDVVVDWREWRAA